MILSVSFKSYVNVLTDYLKDAIIYDDFQAFKVSKEKRLFKWQQSI